MSIQLIDDEMKLKMKSNGVTTMYWGTEMYIPGHFERLLFFPTSFIFCIMFTFGIFSRVTKSDIVNLLCKFLEFR